MAISSNIRDVDVTSREIRSHGTPDFPAACYVNRFPPASMAPHWHPELELLRVKKGELMLYVGSEQYRLTEGMGAFINTNVLHTVLGSMTGSPAAARLTPGKTPVSVLHSVLYAPSLCGGEEGSIFWSRYIHPLLNDGSFSYCILDRDGGWQEDILNRMDRAWQAIADEEHGYEFTVRTELSYVILHLWHHGLSEAGAVSRFGRRTENRLKEMISFIRAHYSENLTLEEIAASASISKSECIRCFRKGTGNTPIKYLAGFRLDTAAHLLRTTDWTVSEIGSRCGFQEMGYFAGQFRRQFGLTPLSYRRREQN